MALKSVVNDPFFEAMTSELTHLEHERGPIALAMLHTPFVTGESRWYLSISALWLDELGLRDAMLMLNERMRSRLGKLAGRFGSALVMRTYDPSVRLLVSTFDIPQLGTAYSIHAPEMFDYDEAVMLVANPAELLEPLSTS